MNKTLKVALSAVLGMAMVAPAFAQNFPDVPDNHWAYGALANLKDKCLFGYPDGFYRGSRMMSRYEFAVAIDKCWQQMMAQFDALNRKIDSMPSGGGASQADVDAMKRQMADLQSAVNGMKGWGSAIADLQKLMKEFESELSDVVADMSAMKKDMADMKKRLDGMGMGSGDAMGGLKIGATVDTLVLAGQSISNRFGLMPDGTILGEGSGSYVGVPVGFDRDMSVLHQATVNMSGESGDVSYKGALVVGNIFDSLGNLSMQSGGSSFSTGNTDVYFQEFNATWNSKLVGQGVKTTLGRFGHQVGEYAWKRTSYTHHYFQNEYRNNGDWYMDGGMFDFSFGNVNLSVFGGNVSNQTSVNGAELNPQSFYQGSGMLDRTLGVQLGFNIGENGNVGLHYLWQDRDDHSSFPAGNNRRTILGGTVDFSFSNIKFHGEYDQSRVGYNQSNNATFNSNNTAWEAGLKYDGGNWGLGGGYRRVEGRYAGEGSWGRVGTWWNPRNVEGFNGHLMFRPNDKISIWAGGEVLERATAGEGGFLDFGAGDKATTLYAGFKYMLNESFNVGVKYEDVKFQYAGADPYQRWLTVMFGYNVSNNAKLSLSYTYADANGQGNGAPIFYGGGRFTGGLLGTQLTVKF